jgi:hypothetical protein
MVSRNILLIFGNGGLWQARFMGCDIYIFLSKLQGNRLCLATVFSVWSYFQPMPNCA